MLLSSEITVMNDIPVVCTEHMVLKAWDYPGLDFSMLSESSSIGVGKKAVIVVASEETFKHWEDVIGKRVRRP